MPHLELLSQSPAGQDLQNSRPSRSLETRPEASAPIRAASSHQENGMQRAQSSSKPSRSISSGPKISGPSAEAQSKSVLSQPGSMTSSAAASLTGLTSGRQNVSKGTAKQS